MKTYLITLYTPENAVRPGDAELEQIMARMETVNADIRAAGGWVFAGGLGDRAAATSVRTPPDGGAQLITDGPFVELKEHLGGLSIVRADDYDVALDWARRLGAASGLGIEIRPFVEEQDRGQAPTTA